MPSPRAARLVVHSTKQAGDYPGNVGMILGFMRKQMIFKRKFNFRMILCNLLGGYSHLSHVFSDRFSPKLSTGWGKIEQCLWKRMGLAHKSRKYFKLQVAIEAESA
jgi:hypothetical protein